MKPDTMELGEERQEPPSFRNSIVGILDEYERAIEVARSKEATRKRTVSGLVNERGEISRSLLEKGSGISDCRIAARDKLASLVAGELRKVPMEQRGSVIQVYLSTLCVYDIPDSLPSEFQSAEFWQIVAMRAAESE